MSPEGQHAHIHNSLVAAASFSLVPYSLVAPSPASTIWAQAGPVTGLGLSPLPHSHSLLEDSPGPCSQGGSTQ